ncbi:MAG TPA: TetR/AcrR family transcriptional regulator [Nitrososphaerales archaeon]|nr:TetR/AcrR family transcriptional regulator [Nitrososphaerales archaeon]
MPKVVAGYKEEARRTILETAAGVFAQKGFTDATMDDVAKELGVSKGAVYQYFSSKDELFEGLCDAAAKMVEERLRESFSGADLRKSAERYMDSELDRFQNRGVLMFEAFAQAPRNASISGLIGNNYVTVLEVMTRFLETLKEKGALRKEMDSAEVAELLIALRHGVLATVLMGVSREDAMRVWMNGFEAVLGRYTAIKR